MKNAWILVFSDRHLTWTMNENYFVIQSWCFFLTVFLPCFDCLFPHIRRRHSAVKTFLWSSHLLRFPVLCEFLSFIQPITNVWSFCFDVRHLPLSTSPFSLAEKLEELMNACSQPILPKYLSPLGRLSVRFNYWYLPFLAGTCWDADRPTFHGRADLETRVHAWDWSTCSKARFLPRVKVLAECAIEFAVTLAQHLFSSVFHKLKVILHDR